MSPTDPASTQRTADARVADLPTPGEPDDRFGRRYKRRYALGKGGMGEVRLMRDQRLGRNVAMKRLRSDRRSEIRTQRFLEEGQLQARLDHPSVVPVYDMGNDDEGDLFFSMKRVTGVTLQEAMVRAGDPRPEVAARFGRRRLIEALAHVALTVEFAHERGVVHRDLKPANVMLGDYGEVYVLDWGIAQGGRRDLDADDTEFGHTMSMLGTPGYASPEQIEDEGVGPHSDIWALGVMLFEIVAREPYVPGDSTTTVLDATHDQRDPRPSRRRPDLVIPPELDKICKRALALEPTKRYATARSFQEDLLSYLDGVRDQDARSDEARDHAIRAADTSLRWDSEDRAEAIGARREAMQELSKSLALDPQNDLARSVLVDLLQRPPRFVPYEVEDRLDRAHEEEARRGARIGALSSLGGLAMILVGVSFVEILDPPVFWAVIALTVFSGVLAFIGSLPGRNVMRWAYGFFTFSMLNFMVMSRIFGPLVLVPTLISVMGTAYGFAHQARHRRVFAALTVLTLWTPMALEAVGLLPPSYVFEDGQMQILPQVITIVPAPSLLFLAIAITSSMLWGGIFTSTIREELNRAETARAVTNWQLVQLFASEPAPMEDPDTGPPGTGPV